MFKKILTAAALITLLFSSNLLYAGKLLTFQSYNEKTKEILEKNILEIIDKDPDSIKVNWITESNNSKNTEEYVYNKDLTTISWKINKSEYTNYEGKQLGNKIIIEGVASGKKVNVNDEIGKYPLYVNPKISLMPFIKSSQQSIKFWGIRNDNLMKYVITAKKTSQELMNVNGINTEVIRVDWGPPGFLAKFFYRTYWFRKSDGMFIKQSGSNNKTRILIEEKDI